MFTMPKISISMRNSNGVHPSLVRANAYLISQNKEKLDLVNTVEEKTNILKALWATEFNAVVTNDWETVEFNQAQDRTLFLLQWG
jgi:hypothetical protein